MRARSFAAIAIAISCGTAGMNACAAFSDGSRSAPAGDAEPSEGGMTTVDGAPAVDAPAPEDAARLPALQATCPAPVAPSCAISICKHRRVAGPTDGVAEFPFAIATDAADVYWVAQTAVSAGDDPYNGTAPGRIFRHSKAGMAAGPTFEIASAQPAARALALDGDFVYWAVHVPGAGVHSGEIRRARRDCVRAPCTVEPVAALDGNVDSLVRARPGMIVGVTLEGDVFTLDTTSATFPFDPSVMKVDAFPALAVTDEAAYASSALGSPFVQRFDLASGTVTPAFVRVPDGGADASAPNSNPGISPSTTDCASLWGLRQWSTRRDLFRFGLDGAIAGVTVLDVSFDPVSMVADAQYIYFGRQNAGGLYALPKTGASTMPVRLAAGNVWRIAVDDDGVYWAEHDRSGPGDIFMLLK